MTLCVWLLLGCLGFVVGHDVALKRLVSTTCAHGIHLRKLHRCKVECVGEIQYSFVSRGKRRNAFMIWDNFKVGDLFKSHTDTTRYSEKSARAETKL